MKKSKVVLLICSIVFAVACICLFEYVLLTRHKSEERVRVDKVNDVPVKTEEDVKSEEPEAIEGEAEPAEHEVSEEPEETEEPEEPEETEEPEVEVPAPKHQHSKIYDRELNNSSSFRRVVEMSDEEFNTEWGKADALMHDGVHDSFFHFDYLPEGWNLEVADIIKYDNGDKAYWYWVPNTDVYMWYTFNSDNPDGKSGDCGNMYGDFKWVMFTNGVPGNSEQIYNSIAESITSDAAFVTDYVEGDTTISLTAVDNSVSYEDLPL